MTGGTPVIGYPCGGPITGLRYHPPGRACGRIGIPPRKDMGPKVGKGPDTRSWGTLLKRHTPPVAIRTRLVKTPLLFSFYSIHSIQV